MHIAARTDRLELCSTVHDKCIAPITDKDLEIMVELVSGLDESYGHPHLYLTGIGYRD